jgi:hypothetical protein
MNSKAIIGVSILAVALLVSASLTSVVGYGTVKASQETEYVDVTAHPCGIKGFGNTTVRLTRQQYENLEYYFANFNARLNQTETKKEAIRLFSEAVIELNTFGLLPKDMSAQKAQEILTGKNKVAKSSPAIKNKISESYYKNTDALVFAYGEGFEKENLLFFLIMFLWMAKYPYGGGDFGPILTLLEVYSQIKPLNFLSIIACYEGKFFSIGKQGVVSGDGGFVIGFFVGISITTKFYGGYWPENIICLGWSTAIEDY